jgi:hypothetical protein
MDGHWIVDINFVKLCPYEPFSTLQLALTLLLDDIMSLLLSTVAGHIVHLSLNGTHDAGFLQS